MELTCKICRRTFSFNEGEQQFYKDRLLDPPKRCPDCRITKREEKRREEIDNRMVQNT